MKTCSKCKLPKDECECDEPDLIDAVIDIAAAVAIDSLVDNIFGGDSSSSPDSGSSFDGFGGGESGGAGAGGEW